MDPEYLTGCFLVLLLVIFYPASATELVNITDTSCTEIDIACNGESDDGCTSATFTPEVDGDYTITASIDNCGVGPVVCTGCATEVYLYELTNPPTLRACFHSGCCSQQTATRNLTHGQQYRVYCCKIPCVNEPDCDNCNTACVSRVRVTQ